MGWDNEGVLGKRFRIQSLLLTNSHIS